MYEILKFQKKATRMILKLKQNNSVKTHFVELNISTVYGLYIYHYIVFFFKIKNSKRSIEPKHNTRNKNKVKLMQLTLVLV